MIGATKVVGPASFRGRQRGLTLIEIALVLVILGIIFSFAAPRLTTLAPRYRLRSYARNVAGAIEKMRVIAIVRGRMTGIRYFLDESEDVPQYYQMIPPAPAEYPDQPLEDRLVDLRFEPPPGVRIRSIVIPGHRGGAISRGVVNVAFAPSGTTGSHIVNLEAPTDSGEPLLISMKYNSISGILDYYNTEAEFQHFDG